MKQKINKKAGLESQTIFYILMGIVFVGILIFGFNKIFLVKDTISKTDKVQIKLDLEKSLNYCMDPMNSGVIKYVKINPNNNFKGICLISKDDTENLYDLDKEELDILIENKQNVLLIDYKYYNKENNKITEPVIVDKIEANNIFTKSKCFFVENSEVNVEIKC